MTKLLVSVMDAAEAIEAFDNGAALIDVKDPSRGSLGAATAETWSKVLATVGDRVPVSAALGELLVDDTSELTRQAVGLAFVKVGLSGCRRQADWQARWLTWRAAIPAPTQAVGVIYADWQTCGAPSPVEILNDSAITSQCSAILFDTYDKSRGRLLDHCDVHSLAPFCQTIRRAGLKLVLAGSVRLADVPQLAPLAPDYFAVRGAVCRGNRAGRLAGELVREWACALSQQHEECQALA